MKTKDFLSVVFITIVMNSNAQHQKKTIKKVLQDSTSKMYSPQNELNQLNAESIPIVVLNDEELEGIEIQQIPSIIHALNDPFISIASFHFQPVSFKFRGYTAIQNLIYLNGIQLKDLETQQPGYTAFSGMTDILKNRETIIGFQYNDISFGSAGTTVQIDARPQHQRKRSDISYSIGNRSFANVFSLTKSSGTSKHGWSYLFSANRKWSKEGYVPGTNADNWNFSVAVNKKIGLYQNISIQSFMGFIENGRRGFASAEMYSLAGSHYYNPNWGYQNGIKRNASINRSIQPLTIISHEYKNGNKYSLLSSLLISYNDQQSSFIDWFNAPDPRPDYYANLPGIITDSSLKEKLIANLKNNEASRQINWSQLYERNRNSFENFTGSYTQNTISGLRSHYVLANRISQTSVIGCNISYHRFLNNKLQFSSGIGFQYQDNHHYKRAEDLLGGIFFPDLNPYVSKKIVAAEPTEQNDLNNPDRIIRKSDHYGWDYHILAANHSAWLQLVAKFNKIDVFLSGQMGSTVFQRIGQMRNGLFPDQSYGKSAQLQFLDYAIKAGLTYKINGRNYLYCHAATLVQPPAIRDLFISAETRDQIQNSVHSTLTNSIELGYLLHSPKLRLRTSAFLTEFQNQFQVLRFYDDDIRDFVNYAIRDISKLHAGAEIGLDASLMSGLSFQAAFSVGSYTYNKRPVAEVSLDQSAKSVTKELLYLKGYQIGNMPGEVYHAGFQYFQFNKYYLGFSANYFANRWMQLNPAKHSFRAIQNTTYGSTEREGFLKQPQLADACTLDLTGGYWIQLSPKKSRHKTTLLLNGGINNILNNNNIVSSGYESIRFDHNDPSSNKFSPKSIYYYGLTYTIKSTLSF